jgi:5-hydroxyisourate hydrolase-like protein (transthyretin family)
MSCFSLTRNLALVLFCFGGASLLFADSSISGTVRNQTTGRPAGGDRVLLLRLENGMQEEARTATGQNGKFSLPLRQNSAERLVRVIHQGVNYDQKVAGNSAGEIAVYDAVPQVSGLTASVGIVQIESEDGKLKITEMYSIRNNSKPPVTQSSSENFEFEVPADAKLELFQAKRAGAVWVNLRATPDAAQQGRYSSDFPIRPGDTLFQFVYRVPQSDGVNLHVKLPYPTSRFAVLHSPSLLFQAAAGAFTNPGRVQGMKLEQATNTALLTKAPAFAVSASSETAAAQNAVSASAANAPANPKEKSRKRTATLLIVLIGAGILYAALIYAARRRRTRGSSRELEKLKKELLALETSRLSGAISIEQYAATKRQLEANIQSSLGKQAPGSDR